MPDALQRDELRIGSSTSMVDQVPTHGPSSYSEEMLPVLPIPVLGGDHAEVNLVH